MSFKAQDSTTDSQKDALDIVTHLLAFWDQHYFAANQPISHSTTKYLDSIAIQSTGGALDDFVECGDSHSCSLACTLATNSFHKSNQDQEDGVVLKESTTEYTATKQGSMNDLNVHKSTSSVLFSMSTPASSNEKQQDSLEYNPDEAPHLVTLQKLTCAEYNQNADNLDNFDSLGIDEKLSKSDVNIRDIKQLEDVDTIDQECSLDHPLAAKSGSTQETPLNSSFDLQQVGSSDSNGIMSNAYADDPGYSQAEEEKAPGFEMEDNTAHFSHEFDSVNFMETSNPTAEPLALDNSHTTSRATSCIQSQAISTSTLALCKSLSRHDQSGDSRANITQGGQSIVRQRSSRSDDSTNIQFGEKLNRPWSYHTYAHHSDIPASIFEFHTIFSQPHKIRPMALATGSVWFRVSPAPDMVHWTVAYRFEHSHTIYSFMIPVLNSCSSFTNSEFCSMLERLSKLNVSPLHKINSIIASKKQQASDPLTQKLFFTKGEDEYGKGGSRSDIVPDTSFYQATYEDAQKVMGRASLDAATMAHIPASTKSWSTTHALGEMEKQHLIEKLTTFQKARVEKGLLL